MPRIALRTALFFSASLAACCVPDVRLAQDGDSTSGGDSSGGTAATAVLAASRGLQPHARGKPGGRTATRNVSEEKHPMHRNSVARSSRYGSELNARDSRRIEKLDG